MKSRKILLAAGAIAAMTLGGCAVYPYDDYGHAYGPRYSEYDRGYYYPGYYYGPSVGFGVTYSDRRYYDGERHHWNRYP